MRGNPRLPGGRPGVPESSQGVAGAAKTVLGEAPVGETAGFVCQRAWSGRLRGEPEPAGFTGNR